MWIFILRVAIILTVLITIIILFIKKVIKTPRQKAVIIVLGVMLVVCVNALPLEQWFLRGNSVAEFFDQMPNTNVQDVVYGKNSCMVTVKTGPSSITHYYLLKTEDGYRQINNDEWFTVAKTSPENGLYQIYKVAGTEDYYLSGQYLGQEEIEISDNVGSKFSLLPDDTLESSSFSYFYFISAYLNAYPEDYSLVVNGKEIVFE